MDRWKRFVDWCRRPDMIKIRRFNPGIGMAALFRGAKAGAVSGVIYGAVNSPLINIGINLPYPGHVEHFFAGLMTDGMWFLFTIIVSTIVGLIFGVGFGAIFAALYDKLPGKSPAIKGIVISIIYWITNPLGLLQYSLFLRGGFGSFNWLFLIIFPFNWGPSIIWGWLLGRFWESERFGKL